jgi:hypothetical protein
MAINYTYPEKVQAVPADEVLIIDSTDKITRRTSIDSILALGTGGGSGGVITFQATNGTFIDFTPNTGTAGTVTLTGDLSATNPTNTTFLRGDNTWSTAITNVIGLDPISVSVASGVATVSIGTFVSVADGGTGLTALGTRNQVMAVNSTATALEYVPQQVVETIKASESLDKDDPVYVVGFDSGNSIATVGKADADDPSKMPSIGIVTSDLPNNGIGEMVVVGTIESVDVNDITSAGPNPLVNDKIYVKGGGGLTSIKPTGTQLIQNVGIVLKASAQGALQITAVGRSNDLPNIPQGNIWVGDSSGVPDALPIGGVGTVLTSNGTSASWSTTGVANYLPLAGGAMTGPITTNSTFDGRDVAADGVTADAALPKAGGTMTGSIFDVSLVQLKEQTLPDASGAPTPTFDASNGAYANISADGGITTFTISIMPSGTTSKLFITTSINTSVGSWVTSSGANIIWAGGIAPILSTNGDVDVITFEFSQGLVYASIIQGYA